MEEKQKMIETLREVTGNKSAFLKDENGGFGDLKQYKNKDLFFVRYVLDKFKGLGKVKAAKSIYIVDKIMSCICDEDASYYEIGRYCCDILEDCEVIKFALSKEE